MGGREASQRPAIERLVLGMPRAGHLILWALRRLPVGRPPRRRLIGSFVAIGVGLINRQDLDRALVIAYEPTLSIRAVGFPIGVPEHWRGYQGMRDFFEAMTEVFGWPRFKVEEVVDLGDRWVLKLSWVATARTSGIEVAKPKAGFVVSFSGRGRVSAWDMFWNWEDALEAARAPLAWLP